MPIYSRACLQHKPKHLAPGIQLNAEMLYSVKQLPHACHVDSGERKAHPTPNNFEVMQPEYGEVEDRRPKP